jgi:hypothetical protein
VGVNFGLSSQGNNTFCAVSVAEKVAEFLSERKQQEDREVLHNVHSFLIILGWTHEGACSTPGKDEKFVPNFSAKIWMEGTTLEV